MKSFLFYAETVLEYKQHKAPNTYMQAQSVIKKHLIPYFGDRLIHEISEDDVDLYLLHKSETHKIYDHKKYLKAIFRRAKKMKADVAIIDMNQCDPAKGRGKVFSRPELARLLWACRFPSSSEMSEENRQILRKFAQQIRFGYSAGCRRLECRALLWEYIDLKTGWVYFPPEFQKTKTTVDRAFMIPRGFLTLLRALRRKNMGEVYVWPGPNGGPSAANCRGFQRLMKRAGIPGYARFHDLRYTKATVLLESKKYVSSEHAQKLLAMAPDTIKRYTKIRPHVAEYAANDAHREAI